MKGDPEQRRVVLRRLLAIKTEIGEVPNEAVDAAAHMLGLGPRQIRRLVANGKDVEARGPFDLTDRMIDFLFAARGDAWKAHGLLVAASAEVGITLDVGPRTFQRAVEQRVDQALRAAARRCLDGFIASTVYLGRPVAHRNDVWAIDHTPAPIAVRPRVRGLAPYVPWVTTVIDEATGMWMAATTKDTDPRAVDTIATLAKAITGFTLRDGTFCGGLPEVLLSDRGGDVISDPATAGLAKVLVSRRYTEPGSPWQNGKVERKQGLWQTEWVTGLPGYLFGDRFSYQRKLNLKFADPECLLYEDQFAALLAVEIERCNEERRSKGKTPAARWAQDEAPIRLAEPEDLRLALLHADEIRVVNKGQIEFHTFTYVAAELRSHHGHKVDIRYLPGSPEFIEVYYQGQHVCRAGLIEHLSIEERGRLIGLRDAQKAEYRAHVVQGDKVNALVARSTLRKLGYAESDLPKIAGEDQPETAPAPEEQVVGQGDLLADLAALPDAAAHATRDASRTAAAIEAAPTEALDELADILGTVLPTARDTTSAAPLTGTGA